MKIGIILHPYGEGRPAGLGRFVIDLASALVAEGREHSFVLFLKGETHAPSVLKQSNVSFWNCRGGLLWLEWGLRLGPACDVYLFPTPVLPLTWRPKTVLTVLDFAYWRLRSGLALKERLLLAYHRVSLRRASRIVAISQATKRDTVSFGRVSPEKISVIYPGYRAICDLPPSPVPVPENFFLSVGVLKERKNAETAVKGFLEFLKTHPGWSFLLAGSSRGAYGDRVKRVVRKAGAEREVLFLDYVSDENLSFLYPRARGLVFPSRLEGFGFPVLESFSCGTPVVVSDAYSLPEVAGSAAILVPPDDVSAIAGALSRLADDDNFYEDLRRRGIAQAKLFSWESAARSFLELFKTIA